MITTGLMGSFMLDFFLLISLFSISVLSFNKYFIELFYENLKIGSKKISAKKEYNTSALCLGFLYLSYFFESFFEGINSSGVYFILPFLIKLSNYDIRFFLYLFDIISIFFLGIVLTKITQRYFNSFKQSNNLLMIKFIIVITIFLFILDSFLKTNYIHQTLHIIQKILIFIFFHFIYINKNKALETDFSIYYRIGFVLLISYLFTCSVIYISSVTLYLGVFLTIHNIANVIEKIIVLLFGILLTIIIEKDVGKIRIKYDRNN